jgi:hypothetical protein
LRLCGFARDRSFCFCRSFFGELHRNSLIQSFGSRKAAKAQRRKEEGETNWCSGFAEIHIRVSCGYRGGILHPNGLNA